MSAYRTVYNSYLLDELHNHFPAILYEPESFRTVSDLMNYIQLQMRLRFDLYSNAARSYRRLQGLQPMPPLQTPPPPPAPRVVARAAVPPPPRVAVARPLEEVNIRMQTGGTSGTLDLLGSLLGLPPAGTNRTQTVFDSTLMNLLNGITTSLPQQPPPLEPVVVRPTAAQIDAGTAIEIVDAEEEVCAICQDTMEPGSQARSLNACDHRFHVACIDTWFQRNVRCPVCRHDVREPDGSST